MWHFTETIIVIFMFYYLFANFIHMISPAGEKYLMVFQPISQSYAMRCQSHCIWAMAWENQFMPYVNNKGTDQPAHPRSLISAFVVHCLDSTIPLVSISKISSLHLASVAAQASLCLTWLETPKTGFLVMWLIWKRSVFWYFSQCSFCSFMAWSHCCQTDSLKTNNHFAHRGPLAQSGVSLTANQGVAGSNPGPAIFFHWDLVMKKFLRSFSLFHWFKKDSCQLLATGERMGTKCWQTAYEACPGTVWPG